MAVTLHEGTTFLLTGSDGNVRTGTDHGLFFRDSRFLARFELRLDGELPLPLTWRAPDAHAALFVLTNPALAGCAHKALGIVRHRLLDEGVYDELALENYGDTPATFTLSFEFDADFVHIFDVKQAVESGERRGERRRPHVRQSVVSERLTWVRLQREGLEAETLLGFSAPPTSVSEGAASFAVTIPPRGRWELWVHVRGRSSASEPLPNHVQDTAPKPRRDRARHRRLSELERSAPRLETDHAVLQRAYRQASHDMVSLRIKGEGVADDARALAAGIPWYMALFGRDSLIASYQTLLHDPSLARGTLRSLAELQGTRTEPRSDEQPGKILHEDRHGPLAGEPGYIPVFPYYGTIDATPLFVITLAEYVRTTGDLALARSLEGNLSRALHWLQHHGDRDGDGFLEYLREGDEGLLNQGWKDSLDSIRFRDGRTAEGAIALVEAQGYAYRALADAAELYAHLGDGETSAGLATRAEALRARLLEAFWLDDRGYFAEALDGKKRRVDALTSNPGHLLWCGAVPEARAKDVARVLLSDALFSGYGIRTMAVGEGAYNPISYHNGSVWPHDTGLIAQGLSRSGCGAEAARVLAGLLDALSHYGDNRLPELFAGYDAAEFGTPIEYPSANRPQAWASGSVILLVRTLLGLDVDALARRVTLRPVTVPGLSRLALHGVHLGGARVEIELAVHHGVPSAEVRGLPDGWSCEQY